MSVAENTTAGAGAWPVWLRRRVSTGFACLSEAQLLLVMAPQGGLLEGVRMASRVASGLKYHFSLKGKPQKREDLEIKSFKTR